MLTRAEQILYLNTSVKCKLAQSKIDGVGVVAIKDIHKGDRCYVRRMKYDSQTIFNLTWDALQEVDKDIRDIIIGRWPNILNGHEFYHPNDDARLLSFMNHAEDNNYDPYTDQALRDIKAGEELTEDYRIVKNYKIAYPWL